MSKSQIDQRVRPPTSRRGAAVAGIIFGILLLTAQVLLQIELQNDPTATLAGLAEQGDLVALALQLIPFAGIAFLWFIGVERDRLGEHEDKFLSTVNLGSGLLYLAMLFVATALGTGFAASYAFGPQPAPDNQAASFARALMYNLSAVFVIRMAAVFMISSATAWMRTRVMPIWVALVTYIVALILLFIVNISLWVSLLFPVWVLVVSSVMLLRKFLPQQEAAGSVDNVNP
jgi:hypothetical protein